MARPLVSVFSNERSSDITSSIALPAVFTAPIRMDIVQFVHSSLNKNKRQAHGVSKNAGMQHSAESWGTGKAVARIPRVSGGGTRRASQGAFGNMCRKGRMFAPLKIWRKWHRKVNINEKRSAMASSLAATAVPSLVMARGHRIMDVPEVPLVLDKVNIGKTKQLIDLLEKFGCSEELERVNSSKKLRAGKGKMRNRRYVLRRGPLIVHTDEDIIIKQAARNIPGVEVCNVNRLNVLQLAPGGHLGRFCIWTQSAFKELNNIFGTWKHKGVQKKGYTLPRPMMAISDLTKIIKSEPVQKAMRDEIKLGRTHARQHKNALKSKYLMKKLNPFMEVSKQREKRIDADRKAAREQIKLQKRKAKIVGNNWIKDGMLEYIYIYIFL